MLTIAGIPRRHGWRQGPDGELERDPEDMTSFHPGQAHLGWNHLPESMYTWAPRPQDGPGDDNENPPQKQDADGRPMFGKEQADAENEPTFCPLEDWWFLPESISTAVEGWELENWMRLGRGRLEYDQIRLRMNLRRVRPTPNTAQMRALRSREENSQACWWNKTGKSDPKSDTILRAMSKGDAAVAQGIVTRNSTRGFAPGLINPSQPRGPGNWIEFPAIAEYQHKKKELSHVRVLKEKEKGSDERFVNGTPATTGRKTRSGKSFNDHDTKASRDAHGKTTKEVRGTKKTKMDDNHVDSNGQGNPQPNGIQIPADWGRRRQELKRIKNPNNFQYDDSDSSEDDGEYGRPGVENRPLSLYSYRRRSSKRHLHLARLEERYRIRQNWATGNGLGFQEVIHGLDSLGNGPLLSSETVHSLMTPSREESVNMSSQEPPKPTRTRTLTDRGEELSFHSSRLLTLLGGTNQGTRKRLGNELNDEASIGVERPSHKKMKTTGHFSSSHPPRTETDLDALMELHTQQAKEASLNELQSKQASKSAQAIAQQPNNGFSLTAATPTGGPTASASYSSTIAATTGRSSQQHQQMLPPGLNPLLQGLAQAGASSSNRANSESAAERAIREQIAEEDRRERQEVEEVTKAMKAAWSKNRKKKPEGQ